MAILDADKEGYLRSATSLIQTAGRAARHLNGTVILYADVRTQSIQKFLAVSEYRRQRQLEYNQEHGTTPRSVTRAVEGGLSSNSGGRAAAAAALHESVEQFDLTETIRELEGDMVQAANSLEFEKAALLRDQIRELKQRRGGQELKSPGATARAVKYSRGSKGRGRR